MCASHSHAHQHGIRGPSFPPHSELVVRSITKTSRQQPWTANWYFIYCESIRCWQCNQSWSSWCKRRNELRQLPLKVLCYVGHNLPVEGRASRAKLGQVVGKSTLRRIGACRKSFSRIILGCRLIGKRSYLIGFIFIAGQVCVYSRS